MDISSAVMDMGPGPRHKAQGAFWIYYAPWAFVIGPGPISSMDADMCINGNESAICIYIYYIYIYIYIYMYLTGLGASYTSCL